MVIVAVTAFTASSLGLFLAYADGEPRDAPQIVWLVIAGTVAVSALVAGVLSRSARRAGGAGDALGPRISRAIRGDELLPPDEQRLAVREAGRRRRGLPVAILSGVAAVLQAARLSSEWGDGRPLWHHAITVLGVTCFSAGAVHQYLSYRRAGAYLRRHVEG